MFFLQCILNTLKQMNIFLVELMNRLFYNTIHQSVCYCWMTVTVIMNCHFSSLFFEEKTISDLLVSVHFWVSNNFWNITEFFFHCVQWNQSSTSHTCDTSYQAKYCLHVELRLVLLPDWHGNHMLTNQELMFHEFLFKKLTVFVWNLEEEQ